MKKTSHSSGFTLLELLVVIGLLALVALIVITNLNNSTVKGKDAKIVHQVSDMRPQANLYTGAVTGPIAPSARNTDLSGSAGGDLFTNTTPGSNSLLLLINELPQGTWYYYASNGKTPSIDGKWFMAAATSKGSQCADWSGGVKTVLGTPPTSLSAFQTVYPNTVAQYLCN